MTTTWSDSTAEARLRSSISLVEPWGFVELCAGLTRLSGSADERRAIDHLVERLRSWGVSYELHEPEVYISWPLAASVTAHEATGVVQQYTAKTPAMSRPTGSSPVSGPPVYLPTAQASGAEDVFELGLGPVDPALVAGRVVVTEGFAAPTKVAEIQALGGIAAVFISPGQRIHESICTPIWGSPDLDSDDQRPRLPVASVNRADGEALAAAISAGRVERLAVVTDLETRWRPIPVLVAEIPGTEEPDRFVLLHGHLDSWHVGIGDNAVGDAALLELARVFALHPPRRSLRIAWWSGHSHGRYAGSTWYADAFALDLMEHCVAHLNCDSPGCRWADTFDHLETTAEAWPLAETAVRDASGIAATWERPVRAGDYSFMNLGLSAAFMLSSTMTDATRQRHDYYAVGGCGGNIAWHTEDDTIEIADREYLQRDIGVYAVAASRLLNAPLIPLDFRRTVAAYTATLDRYATVAGDRFDFSPAQSALAALTIACDLFYDKWEELSSDPTAREMANVALLNLSRLLVPIDFARRGPFTQDPAQDVPPLPDLARALSLPELEPGSHADRITQHSLMRGQNRVVWALRQATRITEQVADG